MSRVLNRLWYEARRAPAAAIGRFMGNAVPYFAWDGARNFGDRLTAPLLRHYGFTPVYTRPNRARFVAVGSVLDALPEDFSGWILGAGLLVPGSRSFPRARVLALRGNLTRREIKAPGETALGDPGLLCAELLARGLPATTPLGLAPHYVDLPDARVQALAARHRKHLRIIDVRQPPARVVAQIEQCRHLLASSLHALVIADALHIPNRWLHLSDRLRGGPFKFLDYASAFSRRPQPLELTGQESTEELIAATHAPPESVAVVKARLHLAFQRFAAEFRAGAFPG